MDVDLYIAAVTLAKDLDLYFELIPFTQEQHSRKPKKDEQALLRRIRAALAPRLKNKRKKHPYGLLAESLFSRNVSPVAQVYSAIKRGKLPLEEQMEVFRAVTTGLEEQQIEKLVVRSKTEISDRTDDGTTGGPRELAIDRLGQSLLNRKRTTSREVLEGYDKSQLRVLAEKTIALRRKKS